MNVGQAVGQAFQPDNTLRRLPLDTNRGYRSIALLVRLKILTYVTRQ